MSGKSSLCSRPFKFVVVGECASGKTTFILRLLSVFKGEDCDSETDLTYKPTFACDGHGLSLMTKVKLVCRDGSSVALTEDQITRQLWQKNFSASTTLPIKAKLEEVAWDDIFVYLYKPKKRPALKGRLPCESTAPNSCGIKRSARISLPPTESSRSMHARGVQTQAKLPIRAVGSRHVDSEAVGIHIDMWDAGGDKSLMWYRWYACTGADAVLLCVPLATILNFNSVENKYVKGAEIVKSLKKFLCDEFLCNKTKRMDYRVPPVLLVGTKSDQCNLPGEECCGFADEERNVVDSIGLKLASEIGCCDFVHCSGLRGIGITSAFETALAISMTSDGKYRAMTNLTEDKPRQSDVESSHAKEVLEPTYFKVHSNKKFPEPDVNTTESLLDSACFIDKNSKKLRNPPVLNFPPPPSFSPSSNNCSTTTSPDGSSFLQPSKSSVLYGHKGENSENLCLTKQSHDPPNFKERDREMIMPTFKPLKSPTPKLRNEMLPTRDKVDYVPQTLPLVSPNVNIGDEVIITPVPRPRTQFSHPKHQKLAGKNRKDLLFVKFLKA